MANRDEIIEAMARTLWADAWGTYEDEHGRGHGGEDLMDAAPDTPQAVLDAARHLAERIESESKRGKRFGAARSATLDTILEEMQERCPNSRDDRGGDYSEREFGFNLAMEALGHGVSWKDDHCDHGLSVPNVWFDVRNHVPDDQWERPAEDVAAESYSFNNDDQMTEHTLDRVDHLRALLDAAPRDPLGARIGLETIVEAAAAVEPAVQAVQDDDAEAAYAARRLGDDGVLVVWVTAPLSSDRGRRFPHTSLHEMTNIDDAAEYWLNDALPFEDPRSASADRPRMPSFGILVHPVLVDQLLDLQGKLGAEWADVLVAARDGNDNARHLVNRAAGHSAL